MILRIFIGPAWRFLVISCLCIGFAGCSKNNTSADMPAVTSPLQLAITNMMNSHPLVRIDSVYTNPSGESFTITRFRYYLSNFSLVSTSGKTITLPPAYFMVDDADAASKIIILDSVPTGNYSSIRFLVGVDSARNVSGVQTGALAPENGLFWTWNSGYIMAQMEGIAPVVNALENKFLFHIGGYKAADKVLNFITLDFPEAVVVAVDKHPLVSITADAAKWFTPDTISFKKVAVIMAPGADAMKIAANYQHMFSVKTIAN
ncbi:MbnP family protein [Chitinophaga sp. MM2321]|uniref:MbnP family protein n=1 Tax=Chitinophaga sp. MM2321 TaxID=3137178 RepID=UPI0032D58567